MGAAPSRRKGRRKRETANLTLPCSLQGEGRRAASAARRGGVSDKAAAVLPLPGKLSDDIAPGTLNSVLKQAGLKEKR